MPLLNGINAAREIKNGLPEMKLLFVTMHASPIYLQAALDVGATGYVLKSSAREEILTAIEKVLKGELFVTPSVCPKSLEEGADPARVATSFALESARAGDSATGRRRQQHQGSCSRPQYLPKNRCVS